MGKAARIRDALSAVAPGGLTYEQLCDKAGISGKSLGPNLQAFTRRGEVVAKGDKEGATRYHLVESLCDTPRSAQEAHPEERKSDEAQA